MTAATKLHRFINYNARPEDRADLIQALNDVLKPKFNVEKAMPGSSDFWDPEARMIIVRLEFGETIYDARANLSSFLKDDEQAEKWLTKDLKHKIVDALVEEWSKNA